MRHWIISKLETILLYFVKKDLPQVDTIMYIKAKK